MYGEYSQTNYITLVLICRAFTWFFAFKIYRQWLKSQKHLAQNMSIWKRFFSAKFTCNVCFIHVVEWADVIKFECWIFWSTFGIILYLGHVSCVQHRFQLSESWCMFILSVCLQVQFCSGRHRAQWIVKNKILNIFRPHISH